VFPSAGEDAVFSNVIEHSIVVRRVTVAGIGNAAKFQPLEEEIRFTFRFEVLKRDAAGDVVQRGICTLPDGRELSLIVNDEQGAATPEGDVRAFAGLRSDPFYLAWDVAVLKPLPNLLQHDNVLCVVVEIDTRRVLDPAKGSLFGAIAETVPISQQRTLIGPPVLRIDWIGRPEQTNIRLNNPAMSGIDDLRDLWNQQTPFAIPRELQPLFLRRLKGSLATWDMLDGTADWTADALAANANVFLDDFSVVRRRPSQSPTIATSRSRRARSTGGPIRREAAARSTRTRSTSCSPGSSTTTASFFKGVLQGQRSRA
jgi:hypothetical protein